MGGLEDGRETRNGIINNDLDGEMIKGGSDTKVFKEFTMSRLLRARDQSIHVRIRVKVQVLVLVRLFDYSIVLLFGLFVFINDDEMGSSQATRITLSRGLTPNRGFGKLVT